MTPSFKNLKDGIGERGIYLNSQTPLFKHILLSLEVNEKLRPPWFLDNRTKPILFPFIYKNIIEGDILAFFIHGGNKLPAIIRKEDNIIFNFDPRATAKFLLEEEYFVPKRLLYRFMPVQYHLLPGKIRRYIKRLSVVIEKKVAKKDKVDFPAWPVETSVETIKYIFLSCQKLLDNSELGIFPSWPEDKKFVLVLSHDIDSKEGFSNTDKFVKIERKYNLRSCWFVVGNLFSGHQQHLTALMQDGFEIGCHDYLHDNKITSLTKENIKERLFKCSEMMEKFDIKGFRSPSLLRSKLLFEALADFFIYDTSVPDTEVFLQIAPRSGCCSVFPYACAGNLTELPITLPLDSTLLALGFNSDQIYEIWRDKFEWIKKLGGVAHIDTHAESHYCRDGGILRAYERFVDFVSGDLDCWIARPQDVVSWWRGQWSISFLPEPY